MNFVACVAKIKSMLLMAHASMLGSVASALRKKYRKDATTGLVYFMLLINVHNALLYLLKFTKSKMITPIIYSVRY